MSTVAHEKKETSKNIRYLRDKDKEMVRGIFRFHEVPGGTLSFAYRGYGLKGESIQKIGPLVDGEVYTLPLGVARHLNKNLWYPEHSYAMDERGIPQYKVGRKIRRASFQSLEFVDIDDLTPEGGSGIMTAQKLGSEVPSLDTMRG